MALHASPPNANYKKPKAKISDIKPRCQTHHLRPINSSDHKLFHLLSTMTFNADSGKPSTTSPYNHNHKCSHPHPYSVLNATAMPTISYTNRDKTTSSTAATVPSSTQPPVSTFFLWKRRTSHYLVRSVPRTVQ